ncbi:uncharacterized protein LOC107877139 [Capsicum annuum]|uniref:uncharacterized protein LOC107877139 n=1 Tax=Capsicum annuum TaxID=4072 RepID=UPI001FB164D0|nr:uncharacterized protein LOC107877139 [Capsicum annuum]
MPGDREHFTSSVEWIGKKLRFDMFRDTSSRATVDSRYLQTDLEACIWGYLWMNDNSTKEFIGKIFIAVVSFKAALGFLLYGERLFSNLKGEERSFMSSHKRCKCNDQGRRYKF